ncbi:Type I restriction-modification system, specificity subunit S [Flavobacterium psychrophilum]|uniref:restriction endonuclease subunit S n=1 Tax=Flavobacterium psychrophilum TaxID=96345 RepID=UPI000B7C37A7|nr:restriction endonuclease subunit S [Flavobacterium psychrophilum]SNB20013.1 Type I restriction-modification system, specificity subunit S [Flavobacterium psychrophilum]
MTNKTYKNTSVGLIPSNWEVKKIKEIGDVSSGGTPDTTKVRYWNGDINWCTPTDITALKNKFLGVTKTKITEDGLKSSSAKILPPFSIIVCTRATIGKAAINTVPMSTNQGFKNIIPKYIDTDFLYYKILSEEKGLIKIANGSTFLEVSKTDFDNFHIAVPPLPEQQKIASILSTWDTAIDNCKMIIDNLKVRNKGLTQKLFNKEFEKKHLSEIFERVTTKNSEKNQNVITISAQRGFIKQTDFFNKIIASNILDHYTLVKKGDFCYNKSYSNGYDWGATKRLNDFEKAVVTTLYICFRLKDENQNSGDFFEYYFESEILYKGLSKVANEGGRAHGLLNVTSSDFFNIKIGVPTFEEQKAIATILDKATLELNQYQQKLQILQLQKKGLMQQLLTGKVRVKI